VVKIANGIVHPKDYARIQPKERRGNDDNSNPTILTRPFLCPPSGWRSPPPLPSQPDFICNYNSTMITYPQEAQASTQHRHMPNNPSCSGWVPWQA
jgi:hypothetical protein